MQTLPGDKFPLSLIRRYGPWALLLLIGGGLLLHALTYLVPIDDAFIVYRYAENFASGHGLVFNPGEHVEGYTDFLWVMLLALMHILGATTLKASQVLGTIASLATLPGLYSAGRRCCGLDRWAALLPCVIVAASASVAMWSGAGLETTLYMLLFTLSMMLFLIELQSAPRFPLSGLVFALATLTRPEAAGMFAVACALALVLRAGSLRTILRMAAGFALIVVPHEIFRLAYYGYPLPNTFYAKTGTNRIVLIKGLQYARDFLTTNGVWVVPFFLGLPLLTSGRERRLLLIPLGVLLFAQAYIIYVGGDFMVYQRFYVPYLPWYALIACTAAWRLGALIARKASRGTRAIPVLLTCVLCVSMAVPAKLWVDRANAEDFNTMPVLLKVRKEFGLWLRSNYPPNTLLAVSALGITPYYSGLPTLDMLGLADVHIAHLDMEPTQMWEDAAHVKFDSNYVMSKKPVIVPVESRYFLDFKEIDTDTLYRAVKTLGWRALSDLVARRDFRLQYEPRLAHLSGGVEAAYFEWVGPPPDWKSIAAKGDRAPSTFYGLAAIYKKRGLHKEAAEATRYADKLAGKSK